MKKELFEELLESVKQGAAIMKGELEPSRVFHFPEAEVRKLRKHYGLSQNKFAALMGISVATLRNWEQGRRKPEGPAKILLKVAAKHPDVLLELANEA
jgi:putative transcriptional regulator